MTDTVERIEEVQAEILTVERMLRRLVKLGDALALDHSPQAVAEWRRASVDVQRLLKPRRR